MSRIRMTAANAVLIVFPVLLLVVAGALAVVVASVAPAAWVSTAANVLLIGLLVWLVESARAAWRARPELSEGPELTREAFPELWATVDEVAALAATAPPTRVVLEAGADAGVIEAAGARELVLGHGLVAVLTVAELRAVLGHEMGHFARGDTAVPAQLVRTRGFLIALGERSNFLTGWLVDLAAGLHLRLSAPARQAAERLADEVSVRAGGRAAASSGLVAAQRAYLAAERVAAVYLPFFERARCRASIAEAIQGVIDADAVDLEAAVADLVATEEASPQDSHPLLRDRLAALAGIPDSGIPDDPRPALDLVGGTAGLLDLEQDLLAEPWPVASWQEVIERAVPDLARGDAGRIRLDLVEAGLAEAASLEDALGGLDTPLGELARRTGTRRNEVEDLREDLMLSLAAGAIADLPGAAPVVDWAKGTAWLFPDGSRVSPRDVIASGPDVDAPVTGAVLAQRLLTLGVDLSTVTDPALLPAASDDLWELWTLMRDEAGDRVILASYSTGVLVLPQEFSKRAARRGDYTRAAQVEECERTFAASLEHLRRTPGAVWFPVDDIADVSARIVPLRAIIVLRDGSKHRYRGTLDCTELIQVADGLGLGSYRARNRAEATRAVADHPVTRQ